MSIPTTMRALQQTSLNGPQDLRLIGDAPVPRVGPVEVLIRITAAGVNFVDILQARGAFAGGPQPPYLAGIEGAREVISVGEGVTTSARRRRVRPDSDGALRADGAVVLAPTPTGVSSAVKFHDPALVPMFASRTPLHRDPTERGSPHLRSDRTNASIIVPLRPPQ